MQTPTQQQHKKSKQKKIEPAPIRGIPGQIALPISDLLGSKSQGIGVGVGIGVVNVIVNSSETCVLIEDLLELELFELTIILACCYFDL